MSRERKRQMIWYQVDDGEAVARHLEKMARKGWLLDAVDNWYYTFRRSEPAQVTYAVTFFPDASYFDPVLMEGQEDYAAYCEAAGWELAASYGPIQYFRTAHPDPLPIETDEAMKLTAIRRTMRKTFVLTYAFLLLLPAVGLPLARGWYRRDPLAFFCNNRQLGNLLILSGIILFAGGMLLDYLLWLLRSSRAVARGGCCKRPHTRFRLGLTAFILAVCAASIALFLMDASGQRGVFLFYLVLYGGIMLLSRLVLRKLKAGSSERSSVVAGFLCFALVIALLGGTGAALLLPKLAGVIDPGREPAERYVYTDADGSASYPRDVYYDELPVTLEDLGYTVRASDHCSYEEDVSRSLLAVHSTYTQGPLNFDSALPDLACQTYDARWPWVLQRTWAACIAKGIEDLDVWPLEKLDPAPWGAEEAYGRAGMTTYYLLYPSRIVIFHLGDDAAPWQLDCIVQALRP